MEYIHVNKIDSGFIWLTSASKHLIATPLINKRYTTCILISEKAQSSMHMEEKEEKHESQWQHKV